MTDSGCNIDGEGMLSDYMRTATQKERDLTRAMILGMNRRLTLGDIKRQVAAARKMDESMQYSRK